MAVPFLIGIVALIAVGLIVAMVLFYKDKKAALNAPRPAKRLRIEECSIEEMADRAATEPMSQAQQDALIDIVARKHKFPPAGGKVRPKAHLEFVFQFCMNPRVNGATIAKLSKALQAANKEYKKEIESMERKAVSIRDKRKK